MPSQEPQNITYVHINNLAAAKILNQHHHLPVPVLAEPVNPPQAALLALPALPLVPIPARHHIETAARPLQKHKEVAKTIIIIHRQLSQYHIQPCIRWQY